MMGLSKVGAGEIEKRVGKVGRWPAKRVQHTDMCRKDGGQRKRKLKPDKAPETLSQAGRKCVSRPGAGCSRPVTSNNTTHIVNLMKVIYLLYKNPYGLDPAGRPVIAAVWTFA